MAKPKRPKDTNELAKRIVDIAIGDIEDMDPIYRQKSVCKCYILMSYE